MQKSSIQNPKLIESAKEKFPLPVLSRVAELKNPFRLRHLGPVSKVILNDSCNDWRLGPGQGEADKPENRKERHMDAHGDEKCLDQGHLLTSPLFDGGEQCLWRS